jgi:hypothetical protein
MLTLTQLFQWCLGGFGPSSPRSLSAEEREKVEKLAAKCRRRKAEQGTGVARG